MRTNTKHIIPHVNTSWNSDRIAASILNKPSKIHKPKLISTLRVMKASDRLAQLYGREAYQAWKRREAEIDALRDSKRYARATLAEMYAENYRRMKEYAHAA